MFMIAPAVRFQERLCGSVAKECILARRTPATTRKCSTAAPLRHQSQILLDMIVLLLFMKHEFHDNFVGEFVWSFCGVVEKCAFDYLSQRGFYR